MTTFENVKLKYELLWFENTILRDLSVFIQDGSEPDEWLITDFRSALRDEAERIKESLQYTVLYFDGKNARQTYIQYHQRGLIKLAGSLVNYVNPRQLNVVSESPSIQLLTYLLYCSLEDLLTFIESQFSKYFDPEAWIPPSYLRIVLHDVDSTIDSTSKSLTALGIDRDLFTAATQPLRKFIDDDLTYDATYREVIYLKQLNKELLYLSKQCTALNVDRSVRTVLHELNFNSQDYLSYCIKYMQQALKEADGSTDDQVRILAKFRKYVHQIQVKPCFIFDASMPSLAELLSDWIDLEADYIKEGTQQDTSEVAEPPAGIFTRFKVAVDLTIAELSYLIGVLIAIKVIQNKNKSALSRFIKAFFQTNRADDISNKSVRKKFYAKDDAVRNSVRKIFELGIKYINADDGKFGRK